MVVVYRDGPLDVLVVLADVGPTVVLALVAELFVGSVNQK
jgi:hypothetical protein